MSSGKTEQSRGIAGWFHSLRHSVAGTTYQKLSDDEAPPNTRGEGPEDQKEQEESPIISHDEGTLVTRFTRRAAVIFVLSFVIIFMAGGLFKFVSQRHITKVSPFQPNEHWGSLSPYHNKGEAWPGIAQDAGKHGPPDSCKFRQVHILHRHAERYPTENKTYLRLQSKFSKLNGPAAYPFNWVKDWKFTLGTDLLVANGVGSEFTAGAAFWSSHGMPLFDAINKGKMFWHESLNVFKNGTQRHPLVLRATTQSRIKTSARAWAAGFFGAYSGEDDAPQDDDNLYKLVLLEEARGINNTLASYYSCPNANNASYYVGRHRSNKWIEKYLDETAKRFSNALPGVDLEPKDVFAMQSLCAYETAAYGSSRFCDVFSEKEWEGYEYANDLNFWGNYMFGSLVGKAQGVGWLEELLARIEETQINETLSSVNTTLSSSPEYFPVDQPLYMDMSHDSIIASVLTALGLEIFEPNLPSSGPPHNRDFVLQRITPFGARLFIEIMECSHDEIFVRLQLNERVLPLQGLGKCPPNEEGLCEIEIFKDALRQSVLNVNYQQDCFDIPEGYEDFTYQE